MKLAAWYERNIHRVIVVAVVAALYACIPAAGPAGDLASCVVTDALKGESIPQIAIDCKADVAAVIAALLSSQVKEIPATAAYNEALKTKAVLQNFDGGSP